MSPVQPKELSRINVESYSRDFSETKRKIVSHFFESSGGQTFLRCANKQFFCVKIRSGRGKVKLVKSQTTT